MFLVLSIGTVCRNAAPVSSRKRKNLVRPAIRTTREAQKCVIALAVMCNIKRDFRSKAAPKWFGIFTTSHWHTPYFKPIGTSFNSSCTRRFERKRPEVMIIAPQYDTTELTS